MDLLQQRHQSAVALETLDNLDVLGGQYKVKDLEVGLDAFLGHRLGNNDVGALDLVTDQDLSRGLLQLGCQLLDLVIKYRFKIITY